MLQEEKLEAKRELVHLLGEAVMMCNHCFTSCLREDDVKMMVDCIKLDKECAEVCQFTIGMLHKSKFVGQYLQLCIQVLQACAEECGKFQHEHCKKCAEMCGKAAEQCQKFQNMFNNK